jgi:hypothetical protein
VLFFPLAVFISLVCTLIRTKYRIVKDKVVIITGASSGIGQVKSFHNFISSSATFSFEITAWLMSFNVGQCVKDGYVIALNDVMSLSLIRIFEVVYVKMGIDGWFLWQCIALEYAKKGAKVVLAARRKGKLEEVKQACLESGAADAAICPTDISSPEACENLVKFTVDTFGRGKALNFYWKPPEERFPFSHPAIPNCNEFQFQFFLTGPFWERISVCLVVLH